MEISRRRLQETSRHWTQSSAGVRRRLLYLISPAVFTFILPSVARIVLSGAADLTEKEAGRNESCQELPGEPLFPVIREAV